MVPLVALLVAQPVILGVIIAMAPIPMVYRQLVGERRAVARALPTVVCRVHERQLAKETRLAD